MENTARTSPRATTVDRPDAAVRHPSNPAVASPAAVAAGLWMRTGFIGASVFAAAIAALFATGLDTSDVMWALFAMALGGGISGFSWRRVGVLLAHVDDDVAAPQHPALSTRAATPGATSKYASETVA